MDKKFYIAAFILSLATVLTFAYSTLAQKPQRPPKAGMEWFRDVDTNKNDSIEAEEYKTASDEIFKKIDRNNDGVIDEAERPRQPLPPNGQRREQFPPMQGDNRPMPGNRPMPMMRGEQPPIPFFVMESIKERGNVTRAQFDENVNQQFKLMDKNGDGAVSREEARNSFKDVDERVQRERKPEDFQPLDSPTAKFIGAEMRFGDKLVKGAPFSAEIVIENTRRLYDGSTITKQNKGAIYRDQEGRTRREQPLEAIGGFNVVGDNGSPQTLVFINDFVGKTHYFLDLNRKVARKDQLPENRPMMPDTEPKDGKTESLGTKMLEGVSVEGSRTTFEIPAGQIGNDKPIQVVTEKWFSPDLQVVVMSRHIDPLSGEHIFRLVNIKKGAPSADLFTVPGDFKIEYMPRRDGKRND